jgi:hypothetical protein
VIEVVPSSRRILLSVRSYFNGRPMEELSEFRTRLEGRPPMEKPLEAPASEDASQEEAPAVEEPGDGTDLPSDAGEKPEE